MTVLILSFLILLMSMAGLAAGVLMGRAPLAGACGGFACPKNGDCEACKSHRHTTSAS